MKKIKFVFRYIKYLVKSVNEHGVHSPFVFDLLNNVIYVKTNYYAFTSIEQLRQQLLKSHKTITHSDFGAGENKNNSQKTISDIAKHSAKSAKNAQLLFRVVNYFQPKNILELGTSLGISTAYLASANSASKVTTIEGSKELAELAEQHFKQLKIKNIETHIGNFDTTLPDVIATINTLDFVFFDGNHRKEPTLNYFNICLQKANENSVFVFDDIYWSDEMMQAWEEIKNNNDVTITIDLFFMGLVFFKSGQAKQHFTIRF